MKTTLIKNHSALFYTHFFKGVLNRFGAQPLRAAFVHARHANICITVRPRDTPETNTVRGLREAVLQETRRPRALVVRVRLSRTVEKPKRSSVLFFIPNTPPPPSRARNKTRGERAPIEIPRTTSASLVHTRTGRLPAVRDH